MQSMRNVEIDRSIDACQNVDQNKAAHALG